MLKELHIKNIVLVESAQIAFEKAFNVLSGETGSGKSAIMNALGLIAGERADMGMIRKGATEATIEAFFDIEAIPGIPLILSEAGIEHEPNDPLIIRREISLTKQGRAFVNNQMAQLSLLKKLGELLIEILGQHANQKLLSLENHRLIVDVFGDIKGLADEFGESWRRENDIKERLQLLISNEAKRLREIEVCRNELEELTEAALKEGEEEELFAEYTLLNSAEEIQSSANLIYEALSGDHAALPKLSRLSVTFAELTKLDPSLADSLESYKNAVIELEEVAYTLRSYLSGVEHNPARSEEIDERLKLINRLKRKYGSSFEEIHRYLEQTKEKLAELENAHYQIKDLEDELAAVRDKSDKLAKKLTEKRAAAAKALSKAMVKELQDLNMPKVDFQVVVEGQKRSQHGDDRVEFFISPNVGEHSIPVKDCASGGELSRVMLALQTLLAGKENIPTLIFDEIDANIGGETAVVIGQKLCHIGSKHQVLCITHFPQVAKHSHHHIQISKSEVDGRTLTMVQTLGKKEKLEELARMEGRTKK